MLKSGLPDYLGPCVKRCPRKHPECSGCREQQELCDAVYRFADETAAPVREELRVTMLRHASVAEELDATAKRHVTAIGELVRVNAALAALVEAAAAFAADACRTDLRSHWTLDRAIAAGRAVLR